MKADHRYRCKQAGSFYRVTVWIGTIQIFWRGRREGGVEEGEGIVMRDLWPSDGAVLGPENRDGNVKRD